MEKLNGMTLDTYLRSGYDLGLVFDSIVDKIDEMHSYGVIHRDLKPDNIFIEGPQIGNIRLIDFGASQYYPEGAPIPLIEKDKVCTGPFIWKREFKQYYV